MAAASAVALAAFVAIPMALTSRPLRRASPRLLAAGHLVALLGWSVLPAGWLACVGLALAGLLTHAHAHGACRLGESWFGIHPGPWVLLGVGLVLLMLLPLAWHGVRALTHARRTELRGLTLARARPRPLRGGGSVWIVPAVEPLAYAGGLLRPRAVVTSGLLALLEPAEREAVLEHEGAHVRLGHPRLLLYGAAVARAYGWIPAVRHAWTGLRRELEVAADDEAARLVGTAALLSALARVGLARASTATASFGDPEHLRYRIQRLQHRPDPTARVSLLVVALAVLLAGTLAWCVGSLIAPPPLLPSLLACLVIIAAAGTRPLWTRDPAT